MNVGGLMNLVIKTKLLGKKLPTEDSLYVLNKRRKANFTL